MIEKGISQLCDGKGSISSTKIKSIKTGGKKIDTSH